MRRTGAIALLAATLLLLVPTAATASQDTALDWLAGQQAADGSFKGGTDPASATANAVMALAAGGREIPAATVSYLQDSKAVQEYAAGGPGRAAVVLLALEAAGAEPRAGGKDLLAELQRAAGDGLTEAGSTYERALAALALHGGDRLIPTPVLNGLREQQRDDGGWGFATGQPSDTNTTALVLMVLAVAHATPDDPDVREALAFLDEQQLPSAGWGYDRRQPHVKELDANSTGLVLAAFAALDVDQATKARDGTTPLQALEGLQLDSGAFAFTPTDASKGTANLLSTSQALLGVSGRPLPVTPTETPPVEAEAPVGGGGGWGATVVGIVVTTAVVALLLLVSMRLRGSWKRS